MFGTTLEIYSEFVLPKYIETTNYEGALFGLKKTILVEFKPIFKNKLRLRISDRNVVKIPHIPNICTFLSISNTWYLLHFTSRPITSTTVILILNVISTFIWILIVILKTFYFYSRSLSWRWSIWSSQTSPEPRNPFAVFRRRIKKFFSKPMLRFTSRCRFNKNCLYL